jgi:hypothetical protein
MGPMLDDSALGKPYDHAVARLHDAGGDLHALAVPLRTLLMVESAQSFIDSGGLAYFYEADFPNQPAYAEFVEAYRLIGAGDAADCIERTSLMFPFDEPHLFEELRQMWLEKLAADPAGEFARLSDRISGDASVWAKLAAYVANHRAAFGE